MLSTLIVLSVCTVLAILITLSRIMSLRTVVKYGAVVDIVFSIALMIVLAGTAVGAASAVVAGLFLAIALTVLKWWFKLVDRVKDISIPDVNVKWSEFKPKQHPDWTRLPKKQRRVFDMHEVTITS